MRWLLFLLWLVSYDLFAAVAFDATASTTGINVSSVSYTHTPVGTPTAVGIGISWYRTDLTAITSITYGGVATTAAITKNLTGGSSQAAIYGLVNPPTGSQTVVVTFTTATTGITGVGSITVTGSDTTTVFSNTCSAGPTANTTPSVTCTSVVDELVMDQITFLGSQTVTTGSGQTQRWSTNAVTVAGAASTEPAASTSVVMDETLSSSATWGIVGASFKLGSSGSPIVFKQPTMGVGP